MDTNILGFNQQNSNTAVQIIDFAKEQIAKLNGELIGAAPGEFDKEIIEESFSIMRKLIEASVRIEALNTLERMNLENEDIIRDIFNDSIFKD
jgi:hypothetical protein